MTSNNKTCTVIWPGEPNPQIIELSDGEVLGIGRRAAEEGERLLTIGLSDVSSRHAEIKYSDSVCTIVDQGSSNGTMINENPLKPGQEFVLQPGDTIHIAGHEIFVFPQLPTIRPDRSAGRLLQEQVKSMINIDSTILWATLTSGDAEVTQAKARERQIELFLFLNQFVKDRFGHIDRFDKNAIVAWWNSGTAYSADQSGAANACHAALSLRQFAQQLALREDGDREFAIRSTIASGQLAGGHFGTVVFEDPLTICFQVEKEDESPFDDIFVDQTTYELTNDIFKFEEQTEPKLEGPRVPAAVFKLIKLRKQALIR